MSRRNFRKINHNEVINVKGRDGKRLRDLDMYSVDRPSPTINNFDSARINLELEERDGNNDDLELQSLFNIHEIIDKYVELGFLDYEYIPESIYDVDVRHMDFISNSNSYLPLDAAEGANRLFVKKGVDQYRKEGEGVILPGASASQAIYFLSMISPASVNDDDDLTLDENLPPLKLMAKIFYDQMDDSDYASMTDDDLSKLNKLKVQIKKHLNDNGFELFTSEWMRKQIFEKGLDDVYAERVHQMSNRIGQVRSYRGEMIPSTHVTGNNPLDSNIVIPHTDKIFNYGDIFRMQMSVYRDILKYKRERLSEKKKLSEDIVNSIRGHIVGKNNSKTDEDEGKTNSKTDESEEVFDDTSKDSILVGAGNSVGISEDEDEEGVPLTEEEEAALDRSIFTEDEDEEGVPLTEEEEAALDRSIFTEANPEDEGSEKDGDVLVDDLDLGGLVDLGLGGLVEDKDEIEQIVGEELDAEAKANEIAMGLYDSQAESTNKKIISLIKSLNPNQTIAPNVNVPPMPAPAPKSIGRIPREQKPQIAVNRPLDGSSELIDAVTSRAQSLINSIRNKRAKKQVEPDALDVLQNYRKENAAFNRIIAKRKNLGNARLKPKLDARQNYRRRRFLLKERIINTLENASEKPLDVGVAASYADKLQDDIDEKIYSKSTLKYFNRNRAKSMLNKPIVSKPSKSKPKTVSKFKSFKSKNDKDKTKNTPNQIKSKSAKGKTKNAPNQIKSKGTPTLKSKSKNSKGSANSKKKKSSKRSILL